MMSEIIIQVVTVKFSKYGKEYSYLCDDDVNPGDYVQIDGKDKLFQVVNVKNMGLEDLPVSYVDMKHAKLVNTEEKMLNEILENNTSLSMFGKDINLIGRDDIIEELLISINKTRMKNSILIGEAGCGKTTIVEYFANLIKDSYYVLGFTVGELVSGTVLRGSMEERITKIFKDVLAFNKQNKKKIILFIDEIHLIGNSYSTDECSISDFMKTYLTDDNIIVIGATTLKEFNSSIKKDRATMRRLSPLFVPNLDDESVVRILRSFSGGDVDDSLLELILDESKEIPNTTNPDISIEILDRAIARNRVLSQEITPNMILKIANIVRLGYEK